MSCGVCSVPGCTQYGLFFKRLDRHLKRVHPYTTKDQLKEFPMPNPKERNIKPKSSKDRHIRKQCRVPDCRYFNIVVSRLSDHLRRKHAITIKEHDLLYNTNGNKNNRGEAITEEKKATSISLKDLYDTLPGACPYWELFEDQKKTL